jgi:protein TonB
MATSVSYSDLVLSWQPAEPLNKSFLIIVALVITLLFGLAFFISSIDLPLENRRVVTPLPERIAEFIEERPKPPPKSEPPPEPKPEPPKPKPTVERKLEKKNVEPLTETQKQARKTAEESGLLALGNELADLFDTDDVSAMVGGDIKERSVSASQASTFNKDVLTEGVGGGSGGVDASEYVETIQSGTQLSERERRAVRQSLFARDQIVSKDEADTDTTRIGSKIRAEEEVTIIFDQNKGRLFSVYNRARRTNPGLKGKVVFELTIAPSGAVTSAKIVSSELNDPEFEKSLLARIKLFKFGAKDVESVTVTFPIEFLPS